MIAGLPLHPLLVHLPVVLLPLAALGLVAIMFAPRRLSRYAGLVVLTVAAGVLGAWAAVLSGNALAAQVGEPGLHETWGLILAISSTVLLVAATVWYLGVRRGTAAGDALGGLRGTILSALTFTLALFVLGFAVLTGHSGAQAVWQDQLTESAGETAAPQGESATTPPSEAGTTPSSSYTLADVEAHDSPESCWAAVDGLVYDLTDWIGQHPGGPTRIENLCGTDATDAFTAQHGGQSEPASRLAGFEIGVLAD